MWLILCQNMRSIWHDACFVTRLNKNWCSKVPLGLLGGLGFGLDFFPKQELFYLAFILLALKKKSTDLKQHKAFYHVSCIYIWQWLWHRSSRLWAEFHLQKTDCLSPAASLQKLETVWDVKDPVVWDEMRETEETAIPSFAEAEIPPTIQADK